MATLYSTGPGGPGRRTARATALAILAIAAVAAPAAGCGGSSQERPNVLLVVISGMRADHVASYGYVRATTPVIDRLASAGILYENAIATAPWGPASQASILTGLYPSEHGVSFGHPVLDEPIQTLAETMKAAGYGTLGITTDPLVGRAGGFAQGFDTFTEIKPDEEGSPDDGAASAEAALLAWVGTAKTPFFSWVVLTNPQLPFNPPAEHREKFLERPIPLPRLEQLTQLWIPFARQFELGAATLPPEELAALVSLYDAEVTYADYRLGRMIDGLDGAGLLDDTLVIVTSDVGEDLGDHGLLAHADRLYDSIVRVPLIMRLPGRLPAGQKIAGQVQPLDLPGAVEKLTREAAPGEAAPGTIVDPMEPRPVAISEARFDPGALRYYQSIQPAEDHSIFMQNLLSVRTPQDKYVVTSGGLAALFDLRADPGERSSVLAERPDRARELSEKINVWAASLRPPPGAPATPAQAPAR